MRKMYFWLVIALAVAMAGSSALAATEFWLTDNPAGTKLTAPATVNIPVGGSVTLYCYLDAQNDGNTFEMMVGYDKSTATTYGQTGAGVDGKVALASGSVAIGSYFDLCTSTNPLYTALAAHASKQVVVGASGREASDSDLGGRPFGFVARSATFSNPVSGVKKMFQFTLNNVALANGQTQKVVLSTVAGAASYSSAWKNGTTQYENSPKFVLTLVGNTGQALTPMATSAKNATSTAVVNAINKYTWVFWGKVSGNPGDDGNFIIDDGSGVQISVTGPAGNPAGIVDGNYVSVRGSLSGTTLTATSVTKY